MKEHVAVAALGPGPQRLTKGVSPLAFSDAWSCWGEICELWIPGTETFAQIV